MITRFLEPAQAEFDEAISWYAAIIGRIGRYPHRNAILGRNSSAEELASLSEPGS